MKSKPDKYGYFGDYGGRYVPETIMPALSELEAAYHTAMIDPSFKEDFNYLCRNYIGRPTPLYYAEKLT